MDYISEPKKLLNWIFRKMGYVPRDKFAEMLVTLAEESAKRKGMTLEWDEGWIRVKISAKDLYHVY